MTGVITSTEEIASLLTRDSSHDSNSSIYYLVAPDSRRSEGAEHGRRVPELIFRTLKRGRNSGPEARRPYAAVRNLPPELPPELARRAVTTHERGGAPAPNRPSPRLSTEPLSVRVSASCGMGKSRFRRTGVVICVVDS